MPEQPVIDSTFNLERNYPSPAERVFAAFTTPEQKRRWYADGRMMSVEEFQMDFRVGGNEYARYQMPMDSPLKGAHLTYKTNYLDIVPDQRIVLAYTLSVEDQRVSVSLVTFEFVPAENGTTLVFTEQGSFFENSGGAEMRKVGWGILLDKLGAALTQ
jgi:uncharacterized protein YndB with AHSA1/START domain